MGAGTHIEYRIRWRKLSVRWVTEIRCWHPPTGFMDVQLRGPYRLWEHTHTFESVDGGTRMSDVVRYVLPLGPLGSLVHACFVKADLEKIFDFRVETVSALLGKSHSHA